jgi:hypothetical protein
MQGYGLSDWQPRDVPACILVSSAFIAALQLKFALRYSTALQEKLIAPKLLFLSPPTLIDVRIARCGSASEHVFRPQSPVQMPTVMTPAGHGCVLFGCDHQLTPAHDSFVFHEFSKPIVTQVQHVSGSFPPDFTAFSRLRVQLLHHLLNRQGRQQDGPARHGTQVGSNLLVDVICHPMNAL